MQVGGSLLEFIKFESVGLAGFASTYSLCATDRSDQPALNLPSLKNRNPFAHI